MAETEQMLEEPQTQTDQLTDTGDTGDSAQSGQADFPTVEPREDDNPHFQAFHDPPDPEK